MELEWLYVQRKKKAEQSGMKMGDVDWIETEKQVKAANNKAKKESGTVKQVAKQQRQKAEQKKREEQARMFMAEVDIDNNLLDGEDNDFVLSPRRKERDLFLNKTISELKLFLVRTTLVKTQIYYHICVYHRFDPLAKQFVTIFCDLSRSTNIFDSSVLKITFLPNILSQDIFQSIQYFLISC